MSGETGKEQHKEKGISRIAWSVGGGDTIVMCERGKDGLDIRIEDRSY